MGEDIKKCKELKILNDLETDQTFTWSGNVAHLDNGIRSSDYLIYTSDLKEVLEEWLEKLKHGTHFDLITEKDGVYTKCEIDNKSVSDFIKFFLMIKLSDGRMIEVEKRRY